MKTKVTLFIALLTLACAAIGAQPINDTATLDAAFSKLQQIQFGDDRAPLAPIDEAVRAAATDKLLQRQLEKQFIRMLKPDTSAAAKDYTCRALRLMGSADSVPALGALLPDENLNSLARLALENIPDKAVDRALRNALSTTTGRAKVGVISSLGFRRDAKAVNSLQKLLGDADVATSEAAIVALGKIGSTDAAKALTKFHAKAPTALKDSVTQACLEAADHLLRSGNLRSAARMYEELSEQASTGFVKLSVFRGLVAANSADANARLLNGLSSDDAFLRGFAARLISELPGAAVPAVFVDALPKLSPAGQVALLQALAVRGDAASRASVASLLDRSQDAEVRRAAIETLAVVATAPDVMTFARIAAGTQREEREAARKILAGHRGEFMNPAIAAALQSAVPPVQIELLRSLSARMASSTADAVLKYANSADPKVSRAAAETLGMIADERQVPGLVRLLSSAKSDPQTEAITEALVSIGSRVREKATESLLGGMRSADVRSRCALIRVLSSIGGAKPLEAARAAVRDSDPAIREAAIRALAEWPDPGAAPDLIEIVRTSDNQSLRVLAFRGFVRLGRDSEAPVETKVKMLSEAMETATSPGDKKLVLGALGTVPSEESLKLVNRYIDDPDLAEEAKAAKQRITPKLEKK